MSDELDRELSDRTDRGCLLLVLLAFLLGVGAAWLIVKGMGL